MKCGNCGQPAKMHVEVEITPPDSEGGTEMEADLCPGCIEKIAGMMKGGGMMPVSKIGDD